MKLHISLLNATALSAVILSALSISPAQAMRGGPSGDIRAMEEETQRIIRAGQATNEKRVAEMRAEARRMREAQELRDREVQERREREEQERQRLALLREEEILQAQRQRPREEDPETGMMGARRRLGGSLSSAGSSSLDREEEIDLFPRTPNPRKPRDDKDKPNSASVIAYSLTPQGRPMFLVGRPDLDASKKGAKAEMMAPNAINGSTFESMAAKALAKATGDLLSVVPKGAKPHHVLETVPRLIDESGNHTHVTFFMNVTNALQGNFLDAISASSQWRQWGLVDADNLRTVVQREADTVDGIPYSKNRFLRSMTTPAMRRFFDTLLRAIRNDVREARQYDADPIFGKPRSLLPQVVEDESSEEGEKPRTTSFAAKREKPVAASAAAAASSSRPVSGRHGSSSRDTQQVTSSSRTAERRGSPSRHERPSTSSRPTSGRHESSARDDRQVTSTRRIAERRGSPSRHDERHPSNSAHHSSSSDRR